MSFGMMDRFCDGLKEEPTTIKNDYVSMPANDDDIEGINKYLGWHMYKAGMGSTVFHYLEVLVTKAKEVEMANKQIAELKAIMADKHKKCARPIGELLGHIEQLLEMIDDITEKYERYLQQPDCYECGHTLTEVRPGKHQCDWCVLERENQQLKTAILKTLEENGHLADGDNCTLISLKQAIGAV